MDEFVLITLGRSDSNTPGRSMCRIIEQCVDYALDHLRREE